VFVLGGGEGQLDSGGNGGSDNVKHSVARHLKSMHLFSTQLFYATCLSKNVVFGDAKVALEALQQQTQYVKDTKTLDWVGWG
jgi:hypothetical protein